MGGKRVCGKLEAPCAFAGVSAVPMPTFECQRLPSCVSNLNAECAMQRATDTTCSGVWTHTGYAAPVERADRFNLVVADKAGPRHAGATP